MQKLDYLSHVDNGRKNRCSGVWMDLWPFIWNDQSQGAFAIKQPTVLCNRVPLLIVLLVLVNLCSCLLSSRGCCNAFSPYLNTHEVVL